MTRILIVVALLAILAGAVLLWLGESAGPDSMSAENGTAAPPAGTAMPSAADAPADGAQAENSFIVCPGDPRCP